MAIWNFRYYLIPSTAIKDTFATDKDILFNGDDLIIFQIIMHIESLKITSLIMEVLSSITNEAKPYAKRVLG